MWEIMITALMRMGVAADIVNRHSIRRPDQATLAAISWRHRAAIARRQQAVQRRSGGTVFAIRHSPFAIRHSASGRLHQ